LTYRKPKDDSLKGTIKSLDRRGKGIIQADGSKVPFLFIDVLSRKVLSWTSV
jgi:hypothetical protein